MAILKVAVTGSAGSGKSIVCEHCKQRGLNVISTDWLARRLVAQNSPLLKAIVNHFGNKVIGPDGCLDRRKLRQIITADEKQRDALQQLIHPEIIAQMNAEIDELEKKGKPLVVVEIPLLFEAGLEKHFDMIVVVAADKELKIQRLMQRDHVTRNEAKALVQIQLPDSEKVKHADFIILNNDSIEQLIRETDRFIRSLNQKIFKTA
ncbi:MAG: dephospho-CoA kinase [Deltaproteobacteria bacterium]|nr:dephospho-CoA kinase [Deltaproteobacteria bacterium]MBW1994784.1 dephospho-CoA kinase [Deltaproteobacteria bacterium]MBW2151451.1 dephospho-CoA kinase [Deltaproteobacteria bacterium]